MGLHCASICMASSLGKRLLLASDGTRNFCCPPPYGPSHRRDGVLPGRRSSSAIPYPLAVRASHRCGVDRRKHIHQLSVVRSRAAAQGDWRHGDSDYSLRRDFDRGGCGHFEDWVRSIRRLSFTVSSNCAEHPIEFDAGEATHRLNLIQGSSTYWKILPCPRSKHACYSCSVESIGPRDTCEACTKPEVTA